MSIRDVIATVNEMENDGVIERYAIGGAVGATFYSSRCPRSTSMCSSRSMRFPDS